MNRRKPARRRPLFDPDEVARLETAGWRAYYDHKWLRMLRLIERMARRQFRIGFPASLLAAYYVVRAAAAWVPVDHDEAKVRRFYEKFYRMAASLERDTRATLQLASVIGRSFYYRILKAISDSAIALDRHLSALALVELVREASTVPELQYMFKHELARDAAYSSILNRARRDFHRRVAEAIEELFSDKLEENAHRLAQHFEAGGDHARALAYFKMAGEAAAAVCQRRGHSALRAGHRGGRSF